jgi:hypothetical protein
VAVISQRSRSTGASSGPFTRDQLRFVALVVKATGLAPLTVGEWVLAETGGAAHGAGHNYLNVSAAPGGRSYSGVPLAGTRGQFSRFASVSDAARETAYWINRMPNFAGIRKQAHAGTGQGAVVRQLAAIKRSKWDAGHYPNGFPSLRTSGAIDKAVGDALGGLADHVPGVSQAKAAASGIDAVGNLANAVTSEPGYLGMWVGLMALGVGFVFIGANRLLGGKPAQAAGAVVQTAGKAAMA